jgi:hypothetical protein
MLCGGQQCPLSFRITRGIMLNFNDNLKRTLQGAYTNYDVIVEKPFVIKKENYHIAFEPVKFFELVEFLSDSYNLLNKWSSFFDALDLMTYSRISDEAQLARYIDNVRLFNIKTIKKTTVKDIAKFVQTWGKVFELTTNGVKEIKFSKKILKQFTFDELIVAFNALIIFNEEVPKKKVQRVLQKIKVQTGLANSSGTSQSGVSQFPKWADLPLNK